MRIFFKKQARHTNGRESRVGQTAAIVGKHKCLEDVCGWHGLTAELQIGAREVPASVGGFDRMNMGSQELSGDRFTFAKLPAHVAPVFKTFLRNHHPRLAAGGVTFALGLRLFVRNCAKKDGDAGAVCVVTLRNRPRFHGNPWVDNVKYNIENDRGRVETRFGECVCFMRDARGQHFLGLRVWRYRKKNVWVCPRTLLVPLAPNRRDHVRSYEVVPAKALTNGALLLPNVNKKGDAWAFQTPREAAELLRVNGAANGAAQRQEDSESDSSDGDSSSDDEGDDKGKDLLHKFFEDEGELFKVTAIGVGHGGERVLFYVLEGGDAEDEYSTVAEVRNWVEAYEAAN